MKIEISGTEKKIKKLESYISLFCKKNNLSIVTETKSIKKKIEVTEKKEKVSKK